MKKHETRRLLTPLTEEERLQRSDELAKLVTKLADLEEEKKKKAREFKEEIDELKVSLHNLTQVVKTRLEEREVEVTTAAVLGREVMEVMRLDTGEVIFTRPLTPNEIVSARQGRLFDEAAEEEPAH